MLQVHHTILHPGASCGNLWRRCRLFEAGEAHELCVCGSLDIDVDEDKQSLCYTAVEDVCDDEWPGLGSNKTDSNSRLNAKMKVELMLSEPLTAVLCNNF